LRADHAGYTKDAKLHPPVMKELARKGYAYENCICQAPFTTTSHASMLSGLYPFEHGIRHLHGEIMPPDVRMIQHDMKDRGYSTHAVVSCYHMSHIGIENGFDSFEYNPTILNDNKGRGDYNPAEVVTDRAIKLLSENEKAFLFLHYFDAHVHVGYEYEPMYRDEILRVDEQIGRFVERCDDDTLFVITADHGKKWSGEHNFPRLNPRNPKVDPMPCEMKDERAGGHGAELYDEAMRVPLIVYPPKCNTDFSPIQRQMKVSDISNLLRWWLGDNVALDYDDYAYMETFSPDQLFQKEGIPLIGIRTNEWKLICYQTGQPHKRMFMSGELYNLQDDPKELNNLWRKRNKPIVHELLNRLPVRVLYEETLSEGKDIEKVRQRLAGMGYI